jgi:transcriptional regulator with PAS, ATPase and Fis domain
MSTRYKLSALPLSGEPERLIRRLIPAGKADFALAALDQLPFGINIINRKMEVIYVNQTQQAFFPGRPLAGRICYNAYTDDDTREETCPWCAAARAFKTGEATHRVAPSRDANGQVFYHFEVLAVPIKDEDGNVVAVMELVQDISNRVFPTNLADEHPQAKTLSPMFTFDALICASEKMRQVRRRLELIADTEIPVLILGETGSGKGLIARIIHDNSNRRQKPMVTLNCANLQETLFESELFGYEKGAFTGAMRTKTGLVEQADGGTLFLDEIGDAPPSIQTKLLRFLETGQFERVGGTRTLSVNVRLLAATNQPLEERIRQGLFRSDLYYRLSVSTMQLPPLRERKEEIPEICDRFLLEACRRHSFPPKTLHPRVLRIFLDYDWPGNMRELKHELEQLVIIGRYEQQLTDEMISARIMEATGKLDFAGVQPETHGTLKAMMDATERQFIMRALRQTDGNRTQAAKLLGLSRRGLLKKMAQWGSAA